jgi:hypothetical protein
MSEAASDERERWVSISSTPVLYHATKDCSRVRKPDRYRDRPRSYIDFHDLDRCPFCHDDLERPIDGDPSEG